MGYILRPLFFIRHLLSHNFATLIFHNISFFSHFRKLRDYFFKITQTGGLLKYVLAIFITCAQHSRDCNIIPASYQQAHFLYSPRSILTLPTTLFVLPRLILFSLYCSQIAHANKPVNYATIRYHAARNNYPHFSNAHNFNRL